MILLSDMSGETGPIRSKAGHVCQTFLVATFDDCFECNLLTVSLIDTILLPLASYFFGMMFLLLESVFYHLLA
jgi:hypothetical protein